MLNIDLAKVPLYITGESHAGIGFLILIKGKFVPSIAEYIVKMNEQAGSKLKLNLKGIAMGNPWTDPISTSA